FGGGRRRFGGDGPRRGRDGAWGSGQQGESDRGKRSRLRLEDWFLAVHLLLSWDDQQTISASDMEQFLSKFLENDAKFKHRIEPRLTSELFLRGMLRTIWDIDRVLRAVNPTEELKQVTAKSPMVLSILR
ncbi:unnamed protein product, partial [Polarella glacialis]